MIVKIPTLYRLNLLAREFIFNRSKMPDALKTELLEGIDQWNRRKSTPPDQQREFQRVMDAMIADSKGLYGKVKEDIARHGLDYRLMYKDGI